jgi:hypothetical protein
MEAHLLRFLSLICSFFSFAHLPAVPFNIPYRSPFYRFKALKFFGKGSFSAYSCTKTPPDYPEIVEPHEQTNVQVNKDVDVQKIVERL